MDALESPSRPAREAYRLWAESYLGETAVSALEERGVSALTPSLTGKTLLDAGCGTGRRLAAIAGAKRVMGIDLVHEMLFVGHKRWPSVPLAVADFGALPFADRQFDTIWCRLALGHTAAIQRAYAELARVSRPGTVAIVTDFHTDAVRAGHHRTFRDAEGRLHQVEHHVHDAEAHRRAAAAAGWVGTTRHDLVVGPEIRGFYESAGALDRYHAQEGLALVLALCFRLPA